jgi:hypothetical protein
MPVKANFNRKWSQQVQDGLQRGLVEVTTDIHRRASILAPRASGALVSSGRIQKLGFLTMQVIFGGGGVRYARRRHFENKKNPQTLQYLYRAGDAVVRGNTDKYFRGEI